MRIKTGKENCPICHEPFDEQEWEESKLSSNEVKIWLCPTQGCNGKVAEELSPDSGELFDG